MKLGTAVSRVNNLKTLTWKENARGLYQMISTVLIVKVYSNFIKFNECFLRLKENFHTGFLKRVGNESSP